MTDSQGGYMEDQYNLPHEEQDLEGIQAHMTGSEELLAALDGVPTEEVRDELVLLHLSLGLAYQVLFTNPRSAHRNDSSLQKSIHHLETTRGLSGSNWNTFNLARVLIKSHFLRALYSKDPDDIRSSIRYATSIQPHVKEYMPNEERHLDYTSALLRSYYDLLRTGHATAGDREQLFQFLSETFVPSSHTAASMSLPSSSMNKGSDNSASHLLYMTTIVQATQECLQLSTRHAQQLFGEQSRFPLPACGSNVEHCSHDRGYDEHQFAHYWCLFFRALLLKLNFMELSGEWDLLEEAIKTFAEGARDSPLGHPAHNHFLEQGFDSARIWWSSKPTNTLGDDKATITAVRSFLRVSDHYRAMFPCEDHMDLTQWPDIIHTEYSLKFMQPKYGLMQYELMNESYHIMLDQTPEGFDIPYDALTLDTTISMGWDALAEYPWRYDHYIPLALLHKWRYRLSKSFDPHHEEDAHLWKVLMEKASEGRLWPAERQVLNILMAEIYLEPDFPYRDLSKAINFMHQDLLDTSQPVTTRIRTVMRFFRPIMTGHFDLRSVSSEVGTYLSDATRLLPNALNFGQDLRTRLEAAADARHLVTYAASYYLQVDQPDKAVALLEQGRALFWTKPLQLRALKSSSFPPSVDPSVHDLIEEMERQMHSNNKRYKDHDKIEVEAEYMYRENLKARVPQMLEAIEKTPGLDAFLIQEEFCPELLAEVSKHGPVVMLVASSQIAHAIMITSPGKVTKIPLPNVHEEGLRGIQWLVRGDEADINLVNDACRSLQLSLNIDSPPEDSEMISTLSKLTGSVSSSSSSRDMDNMDDDRAGKPRRKVKPTRESYVWLGYCFLWYNIVDPVLKSLGISKATGRDRPRLWWCPTGEFCLLPIHAASRGNMEVVSDYVVSSYTPSLRALVDARRAYKPIARNACRVLLGAVPRPATGSPLPNTVDEALRVADVIPEKLVLPLPPEDTVLYDPFVSGLSKASFLSNLSKTNFLHLACHGHQNFDNPFESGFVLRDKYVSMSEIMPIASDNALLAFLSACESARGNGSQPDDATHLAATMLFKGFKSIIGTTWRMDDMDGPEIAETVYRELFSGEDEYFDPNSIAYALDEAVRRLREKVGILRWERWATFLHMGI